MISRAKKYVAVLLAFVCVCMIFSPQRSEEHTSELQSHLNLVCRLLLEKNFFNDTATTEIYTLSLHDALPISGDLI